MGNGLRLTGWLGQVLRYRYTTAGSVLQRIGGGLLGECKRSIRTEERRDEATVPFHLFAVFV